MKKIKFRRFGISTGTKVQQANLRALAKSMAKDPKILIPKCGGECASCPFEKVHARLRKIHGFRENPNALKKLASSGKQLERAYASMLILAREDSPIMFATARLPSGDVSYTVRGKVSKEVAVGIQHFEDPKFRLLAYSEIGLKKGVHLYSLADGITCSGKGPKYPSQLLSEVIRSSGYSLKKSASGYQCQHIADGEDKGYGIEINIVSAGQKIELCRSCASRKQNLYVELTSRVLAKHLDRDFRIRLEHDMRCIKGDDCSISSMDFNISELLEGYRAGETSDRELLEEYEAKVRSRLEEMGRIIYVLGSTCYEDDLNRFIDSLDPSEIERKALARVLKAAPGPVVMDTATPNAVLSLFWDKIGASAIYAVIGDKELAGKIFRDSRDSGKTPSQILRDAVIESKSKTALAALPDLRSLARMGKYADDLARTYKAMGRDETIKRVDNSQGDTKFKSVNCGFLRALDALKGKEWQFTKEELDYGTYLADFAKALLDSEPGHYKEALQNLLTASGSGETVS